MAEAHLRPCRLSRCALCHAGDDSEAASKIKDMERSLLKGVAPPPGGGRFGQPVTKGASARVKADSRAALMRQQDRVAACEAKVRGIQHVECVPLHACKQAGAVVGTTCLRSSNCSCKACKATVHEKALEGSRS
eukprot:364282-Chlamydomonas_euryale.AAC.27